jgi:hypothetical protein
MAIITLPIGLKYNTFSWGIIDYEMEETSDSTGDTSARVLGPSRWTAHLASQDDMTLAEASKWEYLQLMLKGGNVLALYDVVRPQPIGTLRGSPVLQSGVAVGDTSAIISSAGGGVKQGDWLGFNSGFGSSQLVKIMADADPVSGVLTIQFQQPVRKAFVTGAAVTWSKPVAYFKKSNRQSTLGQYTNQGTGQGGFSIDLVERFG